MSQRARVIRAIYPLQDTLERTKREFPTTTRSPWFVALEEMITDLIAEASAAIGAYPEEIAAWRESDRNPKWMCGCPIGPTPNYAIGCPQHPERVTR